MKSPYLMAMAVSSGNILGPLLLFGGIGYLISKQTGSNIYVLAGIFVAFITSNLLIFTTTRKFLSYLQHGRDNGHTTDHS
jgi:hypothetical protein